MVNYSALTRYLDEWHTAGGDPRTPAQIAELGRDELSTALYAGSVVQTNGEFHLVSREIIAGPIGKDLPRLEDLHYKAVRTARDNAEGSIRRIERALRTTLKADRVEAFRRLVESKLGEVLVFLDDEAVKPENWDLDGVEVLVHCFQFDAGD